MLLSARILYPFCGLNNFQYADQASLTQGSSGIIYIQLSDFSTNLSTQGYSPSGLRFMPPVGSVLQVTLTNIDNSVQITRYANQVFPTSDPSIWSINIFPTDSIYGTCDMLLNLIQPGGVITTGKVYNVFDIYSAGQF